MAKIGTAPLANRYDGIRVGPGMHYSFETQEGVPVDGSNAALRNASPFSMRFVIPDALAVAAGIDLRDSSLSEAPDTKFSPGVFTRAMQQTNGNQEYKATREGLANVKAVDAPIQSLQGVISQFQFLTATDAKIASTLAAAANAADILVQVKRLLNAPPLTLLINPAEMSISYTNIQSFASRVRTGYIFERWGLDQPTITFSGSTGAFIAGVGSGPGRNPFSQGVGRFRETSSPSGMQYAAKKDSAAWQNFMSLMQFYKSNGYIYDSLSMNADPLMVGAIAIDYDQWTYVGHIVALDYAYSEASPHRVEWSMNFVVDRMYDHSAPTTNVRPYRAPTPSPSDPVYSGRRRGREHNIAGPDATTRNLSPSGILLSDTPFDFSG